MTSIATMITQLSGLLGTSDLSMWEGQFIDDIYGRYQQDRDTKQFSAKQVEKIEAIYRRYFA